MNHRGLVPRQRLMLHTYSIFFCSAMQASGIKGGMCVGGGCNIALAS